MIWRKWLVRGLVFTVAGSAAAVAIAYQAWTNPAATRRIVLDKLSRQFIGATISLDSASLRLLGGIALSDLRMARRDDLDRGDLLYVPSGVLYHDKEHLLEGRLTLRKIELNRPRIRIVRHRDGRINFNGLLGPVRLDERVPTLVVQQATVVIEDLGLSPGSPLLELRDMQATVSNDPIGTLVLDGSGRSDVLGPVHIRGRLQRASGAALVSLDLPEVSVGPVLVQRLAALWPDVAVHLRHLQATAGIQATIGYQPGSTQPLAYDVTCKVRDGSFSHARLPVPLEQASATVRLLNGQAPLIQLTARAGGGQLALTAKDVVVPDHWPAQLHEYVRDFDGKIEHIRFTPELLAQLPTPCPEARHDYSPEGVASAELHIEHDSEGQWQRRVTIHPEGMRGEFVHFSYPFQGVTGVIDCECGSDREQHVHVDISGQAAGQPVTLHGDVRGVRSKNEVDLVLEASGMPLDDVLFRALPVKSQELARQFLPQASRELGLHTRPLGTADVKALIRKRRDDAKFANRYLVTFHDAAIQYDLFPCPLETVTGILDLQPDHWECHDFHAVHRGGEFFFQGRSFKVADGEADERPADGRVVHPDRVKVLIRGRNVPLDADFERALAPPGSPGRAPLQKVWKTLALRGRLSFDAEVVDRPDQPQEIDVAVGIRDCTMQPSFFPYALDKVAATVRYARGRVHVHDVTARHGEALLGMKSGLVVLRPGGGFQAWFQGLRGRHLELDEALLRALPPALGMGLAPLRVETPVEAATTLTLDAPGDSDRVRAWWDGSIWLTDASLQAGVELTKVTGQAACRGYYNGRAVEGLAGGLFLDQATILGQPFRNVHARAQLAPGTSDVLRLWDLRADLFGGTVGGEAQVRFSSPLHYEVLLEALQLRLEQFGKHNVKADADLKGPVRAALYLVGDGNDLSGLRGNGRVDVDNGKLYRLPPLLDLVKAFGLRAPDGTAFEQARMVFSIDGPQMRIGQLDLLGNAISLRGQGTVNLDNQDINLDFSADWGRVPEMLPPGISDVWQSIGDQMFRVRLRGRLGATRTEPVLLPGVTDPVRKAMGRPR
jgi:hypothetical protein